MPRQDIERLVKYVRMTNIADEAKIDDDELEKLGARVCSDYDTDKASRSDWEEMNKEAFKLAKLVLEEKNWPFTNSANVKYPLITIGSVQFAARAMPILVNGRDVVRRSDRREEQTRDACVEAYELPAPGADGGVGRGD